MGTGIPRGFVVVCFEQSALSSCINHFNHLRLNFLICANGDNESTCFSGLFWALNWRRQVKVSDHPGLLKYTSPLLRLTFTFPKIVQNQEGPCNRLEKFTHSVSRAAVEMTHTISSKPLCTVCASSPIFIRK